MKAVLLVVIGVSATMAPFADLWAQDSGGYFPARLYEETIDCAIWPFSRSLPVMTTGRSEWYGRHLRTAGEKPVFESSTPVLRFSWLRTFDRPVFVRIGRRHADDGDRIVGAGWVRARLGRTPASP